jgi:hypothetical protein
MTREEMQKVLGKGTNDFHLDLLEGFGVTEVDVIHERPLLVGPTTLTKENRDELREAFTASGQRRRFTGYQMAGHLQDLARKSLDERFYFAPTGGRTMVSITARGRTFEGHAVCSEEDVFDRVVGRRIAFTRAILEVGGAEVSSPRCQEHSVAGERPKPGFVLGKTGMGKGNSSLLEFLRRFADKHQVGSPLGDFLAGLDRHQAVPIRGGHFIVGGTQAMDLLFPSGRFGDIWREAMPQHLVLRARALRKLQEAEKLDVLSEAHDISKKERKRLRRRAQALREQAVADAGVAAQMEPDSKIKGKSPDEAVVDEYPTILRNEG